MQQAFYLYVSVKHDVCFSRERQKFNFCCLKLGARVHTELSRFLFLMNVCVFLFPVKDLFKNSINR